MTQPNFKDNINPYQHNQKKGILQNIYFVGFLLIISIIDFVRHAIHYDYKVANIVFIAVAAFLFFKILQNKKKSKS